MRKQMQGYWEYSAIFDFTVPGPKKGTVMNWGVY